MLWSQPGRSIRKAHARISVTGIWRRNTLREMVLNLRSGEGSNRGSPPVSRYENRVRFSASPMTRRKRPSSMWTLKNQGRSTLPTTGGARM